MKNNTVAVADVTYQAKTAADASHVATDFIVAAKAAVNATRKASVASAGASRAAAGTSDFVSRAADGNAPATAITPATTATDDEAVDAIVAADAYAAAAASARLVFAAAVATLGRAHKAQAAADTADVTGTAADAAEFYSAAVAVSTAADAAERHAARAAAQTEKAFNANNLAGKFRPIHGHFARASLKASKHALKVTRAVAKDAQKLVAAEPKFSYAANNLIQETV